MSSYVIYEYDGAQYKQSFAVDMPSRTVKLVGKPQPVKQKYVAMNARNDRPAHKGFASPHKTRSTGTGHEAFPSSTHGDRMPKIKFNSIEESAGIHGFGGGGASGPPYDSGLGTQPAADRTVMRGKKKTMKSFAGTEMTDEALTRHRGASNSDMRKRFEDGGAKARHSGMEGSGGYMGYDKGTPTLQKKFRGASNSDMAPQLQAAVTAFDAAMEAGEEVPDMKNTAPPGLEHMVKGLKKHFGEKSSSPFAIAWHHYNQTKKKGKK